MAVDTQRFLPQAGGALATTKPTATLVPYKKSSGGAIVKQSNDEDGDESPSLEENVAEIRATTKKIQKIIGRTLKLNKTSVRAKQKQSEKDLRQKKENSKEKKNKTGLNLPKINIPRMGFLDNIKNFIGTIILGRIFNFLVEYAPQIASVFKFLAPVAKFIGGVVSGLADKLTSAIKFGYDVKTKVEEVTKDLFGDEGLKKFKDFQGHFTKFMNLALIAVTIAAATGTKMGRGGGRGGSRGGGRGSFGRSGSRAGRLGVSRVQEIGGVNYRRGRVKGETFSSGGKLAEARINRLEKAGRLTFDGKSATDVSFQQRKGHTDVIKRYVDKFGRKKAIARFGSETINELGGKYARSGATNAARRATVGILGKGGTRVASRAVSRIAGKIPIVGPLIDFGVRAFIFKEPLGKAAAAAVGAAAGQALGSFLGGSIGGIVGSVVPFVGNLLVGSAGAMIGGLLGGVIGDQIGASLYNVLAGKEESGALQDSELEAKARGGVVGEEEYEAERRKRARTAKMHKIMPSRDDHMNTSQQNGQPAPARQGNLFSKIFSFFNPTSIQAQGFVNPFDKIKGAVKRLRQSNSNILSKIMALGADLVAGKKPNRRAIQDIIKALVTFFDAAIPAPVNLIRNILQKLAGGGYVLATPQEERKKLKDMTRVIERKFLTDITRDTTSALNLINGIPDNTQTNPNNPNNPTNPGGSQFATRMPASTGQSLSGSSKLSGVSGNSGSVFIGGSKRKPLAFQYTPFSKTSVAAGGIVVTSAKGLRFGRQHNGYDIAAPTDTPMYAYMDGEVTHVNTNHPRFVGDRSHGAGYGYWVVWKDAIHGAYHFFGHLHRPPAVAVGDKFKAGALLGNVGNTGVSDGPHLHWEISTSAPAANGQFTSYVDPLDWINRHSGTPQAQTQSSIAPVSTTNLASQANYEVTGTVIAVLDTTKIVKVPASASGRSHTSYVKVHKDAKVISPTG